MRSAVFFRNFDVCNSIAKILDKDYLLNMWRQIYECGLASIQSQDILALSGFSSLSFSSSPSFSSPLRVLLNPNKSKNWLINHLRLIVKKQNRFLTLKGPLGRWTTQGLNLIKRSTRMRQMEHGQNSPKVYQKINIYERKWDFWTWSGFENSPTRLQTMLSKSNW